MKILQFGQSRLGDPSRRPLKVGSAAQLSWAPVWSLHCLECVAVCVNGSLAPGDGKVGEMDRQEAS